MKKYILMVMSTVVLGFTSCSEDTLDEINKDNRHPSPDMVTAVLQLTDAVMSTGFNTVSGDYAFYLGSLNEQEIGVGNNQLMKAEMRNASELASSTTFNNTWNSTYSNLLNIQEMIRKVETEVPGNVGQFDILGMAQVLKALNFGVLTDLHGDIPYSEALKGQEIPQPKLDLQKDIYTGILTTLDEAITNLDKGAALKTASKQDILYGGDAKKWKSLAYALKARYLLHQLAVDSSVLSKAKAAALKAVELGFDGASITEFNGVNCDNPWSAFIWSRSYTASSTTVADIMEAYGDPRLPYYKYDGRNPKAGEGNKAYAPGVLATAQVADGSLAFPAWYDLGSQPLHLFSKAELYFILAETQLRSSEDATAAFQTAVESSVSEIMDLFGDKTDAAAYAASLGAPTLKKLFEQKYIAQSYDEQVETYNDLRRLKAMGENYVALKNPNNTQSGINRYPERLPYGNSSVLGNPEIIVAYGDGTYIYTDKTWINKGK